MTVSSDILDDAARTLSALDEALGTHAALSVATLGNLVGDVDMIETHWSGPRASALLAQIRSYFETLRPFPDAVASAQGTVKAWHAVAVVYATMLKLHENTIRQHSWRPFGLPFDTPFPSPDDLTAVWNAQEQIAEIDAQWQRTCASMAGELSGAITAIKACNDAMAIAVGSAPSIPTSGGAEGMASWWSSLTTEQKLAVVALYPGRVGNADGMPAWVRDLANRTLLAGDLAYLQAKEGAGTLSQFETRVLENARSVRGVLFSHEGHADPLTGDATVSQLYIYDPRAFGGDGRIAIAIGDLDTARHLAVSVPGMMSDATGLGSGRTQNIYDESRWASGQSVAVLDWLGYDAPNFNTTPGSLSESFTDAVSEGLDIAGVANQDMATEGARRLAATVHGLNAMRAPDAHLTVIGNSYGSTTAAIAADEFGLEADDLVLTGSPGAGNADNADDFTTGDDHTWVGSASHDVVTYLGETGGWDPADALADALPGVEQMGNDPSEDAFDANRFRAENVDRGDSWNIDDHGRYFSADSESLYNVSAVVTGDYDAVTAADPRHKDPFVETHNPVEEFDVDAHVDVDVDVDVEMCETPLVGVPFPCGGSVDANVDAGVDVDLDVRSPVEVNAWPVDPEGSRTPVPMTHE